MQLKTDSAKPIRVLVIEDSEDDTLLLLHELRRAGYEPRHNRVASAEGMEAALQVEHWDVVIADQNLPGFTGIEALDLLRKRQLDDNGSPVIGPRETLSRLFTRASGSSPGTLRRPMT